MRFIPYPKEVEDREARLKKRYGDCYGCRNHCETCWSGVCGLTQMPLSYPIHGCQKKDYSRK